MSLAHRRSRSSIIDPAYSATRVVPSIAGLSRFAPLTTSGACWLYGEGDVEAYRMSLTRKRGFSECLNVFHPGLFDRHRHLLLLRHQTTLDRLPRACWAVIRHSGDIKLSINDRLVLRATGTSGPVARRIDLRPFLRVGKNSLSAILGRIDEPAALCIESPLLRTTPEWSSGVDGFHWNAPACFPWVASALFPHQEELPTLRLTGARLADGTIDFGRELIGHLEVSGAGPSAKRPPRLRVGESLAESRNADAAADEQALEVERVGKKRFRSIGRVALRYARFPRTSASATICCDATFHPACYRGAFACSDQRITRIWMASAYTLRLCMQDFLVDGIKRDRMPWVGDLYLALLSNAYSFADAGIVRRTLTALFGDRPEQCHFNGILDYTLYWIVCLDAHVRHFGDVAYARAMWPRVRLLHDALERRRDARGWLVAGAQDWLFLDWVAMDKSGAVAAIQMLHALALGSAARLAGLCDDGDRARILARDASTLRRRCTEAFWDERAGGYVENIDPAGKRSRTLSRHANAFAVIAGVASAAQRPAIARVLLGATAQPMGTPYMMFFESLALARLGEHRRVLSTMSSYWGGMLDRGATTFWEAYDPAQSGGAEYAFYGRPFAKSLCHAWSAGPAALLPAEICGVRPLADGWSSVVIDPRLGDLEWASACVPTPVGDIEIDVQGREARASLPGSIALGRLPARAIRSRSGGRQTLRWTIPREMRR